MIECIHELLKHLRAVQRAEIRLGAARTFPPRGPEFRADELDCTGLFLRMLLGLRECPAPN